MLHRPKGFPRALRRRGTAGILTIAALFTACDGGPGGTTEPRITRMKVHLPSSTTDTIEARLLQPLTVEMIGPDGAPLAGITVRFESLDDSPHPSYPGFREPHVSLSRVGRAEQAIDLTETTDALGRAGVSVRLGPFVGGARVRVSAPLHGLVDTATFTVTAGAPQRARFAGSDTALHAGGSLALAASVVDRAGNPTPSPLTFSLSGDANALAISGTTVTGVAFGNGVVRASWGTLSDSLRVTVVPPARLVVVQYRVYSSDSVRVWLMNMDLSGKRMLGGPSNTEWSSRAPSWSSTGRVALHMGYHTPRMFFVDTATGAVTRAVQYSVPLNAELAPEYTKDGAWVYFWGVPDHQNGALWRMRSDGSAATRIGPVAGWYDIDAQPSPSPDGTRVVYWSNRTNVDTYRPTIRVLTVATGEVVDLAVSGTEPRWSPVGDDILFRQETTLKIMKADGTGQRVIGNATGDYGRPARWSPDGQWVIAQGGAGLHVINVASNLILRLPMSTARYGEVAWRP